MSLKNTDNKNRWRNKTVAFRVSPEEDERIESAVDEELMETIGLIAVIMDGMRED